MPIGFRAHPEKNRRLDTLLLGQHPYGWHFNPIGIGIVTESTLLFIYKRVMKNPMAIGIDAGCHRNMGRVCRRLVDRNHMICLDPKFLHTLKRS